MKEDRKRLPADKKSCPLMYDQEYGSCDCLYEACQLWWEQYDQCGINMIANGIFTLADRMPS